MQGSRSKFLSGGGGGEGGGEGGGAKLDGFFWGRNAWEFLLFTFSKVTENALIAIKLLIFFHLFSDVAKLRNYTQIFFPKRACQTIILLIVTLLHTTFA